MFQQNSEFPVHTVNYWQETDSDLALVKDNTIHSHTAPIKLGKCNVQDLLLKELEFKIFNTCNIIFSQALHIKMVLWKVSNGKNSEENLHLFAKRVNDRKADSAPGRERLALLRYVSCQVGWQSNSAKGKMAHALCTCPRLKPGYPLLCFWAQNSLG